MVKKRHCNIEELAKPVSQSANDIPLDIKVDRPNRKTIKALKEGDRIANDPNAKTYTNVHDMMEALLK